MANATDATDTADARDSLKDAYRLVLALVEADTSEAIRIQHDYDDASVRDLLAATNGVCVGIFKNVSPVLRTKLAASLRFGITGDQSELDGVRADDPLTGQYL